MPRRRQGGAEIRASKKKEKERTRAEMESEWLTRAGPRGGSPFSAKVWRRGKATGACVLLPLLRVHGLGAWCPCRGCPLGRCSRRGRHDRRSPLWLPLVLLLSCIHGIVNPEALRMMHVDRGRMVDLRWGLGWGLLSGLLDTTSGVLEVPTGGWPLAKVLALFILWASVSTSLQDEDK